MLMDLSRIEHKIDTTAYSLFREFTKAAIMDFPSYTFAIKDESLLPVDLRNSKELALDNIKLEKKEKGIGYKIGFFRGFTKSNLNCCWCSEYIKKRSNEYKTIRILQTINQFFMKKENLVHEINSAYYQNLDENVNFLECDPNILIDTQTIKNRMTIALIGKIYEKFEGDCFNALDNIITEKVYALAFSDNNEYLPDIENYFSSDPGRRFLNSGNIFLGNTL